MDAQRGGTVLGVYLAVLQLHLEGLEKAVGQLQQPDAPYREHRPVGESQHTASQGRHQAEEPGCISGTGAPGNRRRPDAAQPQQGGGDIHGTDGGVRHAAALVLQLVEKDGDGLVDFGEQPHRQQKDQQPRRRQGGAQRGGKGFAVFGLRRRRADLGEAQAEQCRRPVAEHREQRRQAVVFPDEEGVHRRGRQQPRHAQAFVNAKDMLAVFRPGTKVQDTGVHPGQPGNDHTEQHPLRQKPAEVRCLPEDDLGQKIQPAAKDHRSLVADAVRYHAPGHLQRNAQRIGDALDESDLENCHPLGLPVEGGDGAVKDHALQKGHGI